MNSMTETNSSLRQKMTNDPETDVSEVNRMFELSLFLQD